MNRVVARFADGRIVKGMTSDFTPTKELFHIAEATAPPGAKPINVRTGDLKALFFVKDFAGNPQHSERNEFDPARPAAGRCIRVAFRDGEVLVGTTNGYQPGRPGFLHGPGGRRVEHRAVLHRDGGDLQGDVRLGAPTTQTHDRAPDPPASDADIRDLSRSRRRGLARG